MSKDSMKDNQGVLSSTLMQQVTTGNWVIEEAF